MNSNDDGTARSNDHGTANSNDDGTADSYQAMASAIALCIVFACGFSRRFRTGAPTSLRF